MSGLYQAAGIVFFFNLVSKMLGYFRDAVLAAYYGAGSLTDAYMIAYTLPYSLQAVLGMAFLTVMVPFLTGFLMQGKRQEAFRLTSVVVRKVGFWLLVLVVLGMILARPVTRIMAPGFDEAAIRQTAGLMRVMLPSIFLMGMGMLYSGVLNAEKKFALVAFAPGLVNILMMLGIILLNGTLGIYGAAVGTLAGFAGFYLLLWRGIRKMGFSFSLSAGDPEGMTRPVLQGILPVAVSVSVNQVLLAVSRFFASGLEAGSISALDFANRIMNLPLGIFTAAVVTAAFPLMTEGAARNETEKLASTLIRGIRAILVFIIPVSVGMVILRVPLVELLYQRGQFMARDTVMTAGALYWFSVALPAFSSNMMMTRAFYAYRDYRTPLLAGLAAVAVNAAASRLLVGAFAHNGLAAANALAAYSYTLLLLVLLVRRLGRLNLPYLARGILKSMAASALMGWAVLSLRGFIATLRPAGTGTTVLILGAGALAGVIIYFSVLKLLKYEELNEALGFLRKRRTKEKR